MAFALRLTVLLCGISGLLTGVWSFPKVKNQDKDCPKGWTRLDCHCYIYQAHERTFADAESVCNILGGNLVSIHNALENAFVLELIRAGGNTSPIWIGLTDAIEENHFIWTDGSKRDFFPFAASEPNNSGDCIELYEFSGLWDDTGCARPFPYVCIRDVIPSSH
ncbi:lectin-like isoform X4 [Syngnathus acus]|uniref:lectin-like isoform X4 n=1 Tax=Syngnathus acus TaxID=161584 RepID=UPI001886489A|nr:lectin-like isoform X4 [Syngnathus acus]